MTKRVNVQEVFNKVIDAGIYGDDRSIGKEAFMCYALGEAVATGVISKSERQAAESAIYNYFDSLADFNDEWDTICMCNAMFHLGRLDLLDCNKGLRKEEFHRDGYACTAVYRNWYRRPKVG